MPDYRLNSRSPYYIDGEVQITEATPPDPVEENTPPTVTITASNETPYLNSSNVGEPVTLTAVATDSDGTIVSYEWSTEETTESIQVDPAFQLSPNATEGCVDFYVVVTDDDGDTATASKRICWQKVPEIITNPSEIEVECGDVVNRSSFTGELVYKITDVGDKIGDIEIAMVEDLASPQDVPVKFTLEWDGNTSTTDYIGASEFDAELEARGVSPSDIATATESTKEYPAALTLAKTAATPSEVYIKVTTPLINDSYGFTINCPTVTPAVTTKFYTLEGTDAGGNTTFTYTDNNGNSQNVILSNGETELVSAREDTVSVVSGPGNITEGGLSFDNGTPDLTFDDKTDIVILFDDSGSMGETEQPLMDMTSGVLRDTLLSYYQGNVSEYEKRVNVYKYKDFAQEFIQPVFPDKSVFYYERFLKLANYGKINSDASRVVYLIFTDEVQYSGTTSSFYKYQTEAIDSSFSGINQLRSLYPSELADYRTYLNTLNYGEHLMRLFAIQKPTGPTDPVTVFLQNIFTGQEGFYGSRGLSDRSETSIESDILRNGVSYSSDKYYYYNYVIKALRDYGFNI